MAKIIRQDPVPQNTDRQKVEFKELSQVAEIVFDLINDTTGKIPIVHVQSVGKSKEQMQAAKATKYKNMATRTLELELLNKEPCFSADKISKLGDLPDEFIVVLLRKLIAGGISGETVDLMFNKSKVAFRMVLLFASGYYEWNCLERALVSRDLASRRSFFIYRDLFSI